MRVTAFDIVGLVLFEPAVFTDERGSFFESFNQRGFLEATGFDAGFVQDNHSTSRQGVLRGLHYQLPPHEQGKLVRVVRGSVFDVAVDIRRGSPTFGRWAGVELSAGNRRQLWIPPGFAHGFCARSDGTEVVYKTTGFYSPPHERCIRWDDPGIGIAWGLAGAPIVSARDASGPRLAEIAGSELF